MPDYYDVRLVTKLGWLEYVMTQQEACELLQCLMENDLNPFGDGDYMFN
jgi:hypothetical protein